jgi:hypothetical protein
MLRVLKLRSAMSVGVWTLAAFGATVLPAWLWSEGWLGLAGAPPAWLLLPSALLGALLSTYTGVLLAVTVVPVWNRHRLLLPVHAAVAGLGSAAASIALIVRGVGAPVQLVALAAVVETLLLVVVALGGEHADRPLRQGRSGMLVLGAGLAMGPAALLLWYGGRMQAAALAFLAGALASRFGWLEAGRVSAGDPLALLGTASSAAPAARSPRSPSRRRRL